jgi:hypothetical protein
LKQSRESANQQKNSAFNAQGHHSGNPARGRKRSGLDSADSLDALFAGVA